MVEKISPTSRAEATPATRVDRSLSLAEPDNAWAAARQSEINDGLGMLHDATKRREGSNQETDDSNSDRHLDPHREAAAVDASSNQGDQLSGESARIGTGNLEDNVPFGDHVGYV